MGYKPLPVTDSSGGATADGTIGAVTAPTAITDSSGGTANASTAVVAAALKKTVIIPIQLAALVNSGVWKVGVPFAATVLAALFRTGKPASASSKAATLTVTTNGGGAVTGGVMALTTANQNTTGGTVSATAISGAGATITAGQTIEVTVSSVTAFTEGDGYVEFTVSNNDLANTVATALAGQASDRTAIVALTDAVTELASKLNSTIADLK